MRTNLDDLLDLVVRTSCTETKASVLPKGAAITQVGSNVLSIGPVQQVDMETMRHAFSLIVSCHFYRMLPKLMTITSSGPDVPYPVIVSAATLDTFGSLMPLSMPLLWLTMDVRLAGDAVTCKLGRREEHHDVQAVWSSMQNASGCAATPRLLSRLEGNVATLTDWLLSASRLQTATNLEKAA